MKKKLKITVTVLLVILAIAVLWMLGISSYIKESVKGQILSDITLDEVDCIIVLGCLVRPDGTPSGMLEDRLTTGVELWQSGVSDTLLMSGDHGTAEYDEVNAMRDFAVEKGVPAERVFMDHAGFSTYDSIYRLKEIFGAKKVVIVTQEYHLYRALYIANSLGLEAYGVSADLHRYYGQIKRDVREIIARNKDFLYCVFKPLPKYLGDKIDLNGNAETTMG